MEIALTRSLPLAEPDADLVQRMALGDEEALCSLYSLYGRRLLAYAFRLTAHQGLAEEVVQDSLMAAWKGAGRFRGEARVITWLLGIVHHLAMNATRRRRLPTAELDQAEEMPDGAATPERRAEAADRRRIVRAALANLSPEHRAAIELVFYGGLSLAETAQVCRCPEGTVKSRLSYARTRLREALARAGLGVEDLL